MKTLVRNTFLLITSPKDFLYSFFCSKETTLKIVDYDHKVKKSADVIKQNVELRFPELKVNIFGSIGLGIAGKNDLDLYVECNGNNFDEYIETFNHDFGEYAKKRPDYIEWDFVFKKAKAELILIDGNSKRFKRQSYIFNLIKENDKYLMEYERIKLSLSGKTEKEYILERMVFFNKIILIEKLRSLFKIPTIFNRLVLK